MAPHVQGTDSYNTETNSSGIILLVTAGICYLWLATVPSALTACLTPGAVVPGQGWAHSPGDADFMSSVR